MNTISSSLMIALLWLIHTLISPQLASASLIARPALAINNAGLIHTVRTGENLFRIALNYGVSSQAIMSANGLRSVYVYVGQRLFIPKTGAPAAPAAYVSPRKSPARQSPAALPSTGAGATKVETAASVAKPAAPTVSGEQVYLPMLLDQPEGPKVAAAPNVPPIGKYIWVSLRQQRMFLYENGQLVREIIVSTGRAGSETAIGNFRIKTKLARPYSRLWDLWMPNWLGIYDVGSYENGFHAYPSTPNGTVIWQESLGKPASFGCIVMLENDSAALYTWAEIGTPVSIRP